MLDLAKKIGVSERIIFTGSVSAADIADLNAGEVYLNKSFFKIRKLLPKDVVVIKKYMDSFNCANIKGINLSYKICTEEFLNECKEQKVAVSVFVVDKQCEIDRLAKRSELANITTNYPDTLLKLLDKKILK
ncbi:MAG: hypothetical protein EOM87_02450 [Clostridia bacterium]|nr:hypothetical protein [Clostridia bacterium]